MDIACAARGRRKVHGCADLHQARTHQREDDLARMKRPQLARGISARIELQTSGKRGLQRRFLPRIHGPALRGLRRGDRIARLHAQRFKDASFMGHLPPNHRQHERAADGGGPRIKDAGATCIPSVPGAGM